MNIIHIMDQEHHAAHLHEAAINHHGQSAVWGCALVPEHYLTENFSETDWHTAHSSWGIASTCVWHSMDNVSSVQTMEADVHMHFSYL